MATARTLPVTVPPIRLEPFTPTGTWHLNIPVPPPSTTALRRHGPSADHQANASPERLSENGLNSQGKPPWPVTH
jgi:hypothetical protein